MYYITITLILNTLQRFHNLIPSCHTNSPFIDWYLAEKCCTPCWIIQLKCPQSWHTELVVFKFDVLKLALRSNWTYLYVDQCYEMCFLFVDRENTEMRRKSDTSIKHYRPTLIILCFKPCQEDSISGNIKLLLTFSIIDQYRYGTGSGNPPLMNIRVRISCIANIMVTYVLATQGAMASTPRILT